MLSTVKISDIPTSDNGWTKLYFSNPCSKSIHHDICIIQFASSSCCRRAYHSCRVCFVKRNNRQLDGRWPGSERHFALASSKSTVSATLLGGGIMIIFGNSNLLIDLHLGTVYSQMYPFDMDQLTLKSRYTRISPTVRLSIDPYLRSLIAIRIVNLIAS